MGQGSFSRWVAVFVGLGCLVSSIPSRADVVENLGELVVRLAEASPGVCVVRTHHANPPHGDCDALPPKTWLTATQTDPMVIWVEERSAPWGPALVPSGGRFVATLHFRSGSRVPFGLYAIPPTRRALVGFDPKAMLGAAWGAFANGGGGLVPAGPTPEASEGKVDGVTAYHLEGEHTRAGRVQHTSMTVVPSAEATYLFVSAGSPTDAVVRDRGALLAATHVKAPISGFALEPGTGFYALGALLVVVGSLVLRLKTGINPLGWLRRSR